jgi:ZIP family zinc transporter
MPTSGCKVCDVVVPVSRRIAPPCVGEALIRQPTSRQLIVRPGGRSTQPVSTLRRAIGSAPPSELSTQVTSLLRTTLLYSLVPVVFTMIGAATAAFWPVMARLRSYVLHLAAGVVFSVVAVELLPEIQRRAATGGAPVRDVVLGFALGIGTMLAVDKVLDRIRGDDDDKVLDRIRGDDDDERCEVADDGVSTGAERDVLADTSMRPSVRGGVALSLLVAVGIDFVLDGLLLGVGFAAGARIGILLALAEAAEQLSVGLALAGELSRSGMARMRVLATVTGLGLLVFGSAVLGATVLRGLTSGMMETVLSFGLAALLYLVTEELLREAHEERDTTAGTAMFFLGFPRVPRHRHDAEVTRRPRVRPRHPIVSGCASWRVSSATPP